jgi:protein-disulfide isomerase
MRMRFRKLGLACAAAAAVAAGNFGAPASAQSEFTPEQRRAMHEVIRSYLLENPEVIADAIRMLEEKQRMAAEQDAKLALNTHRRALFDDPATPSQGEANADVTLVEFFDYRCGVCRRVYPVVANLMSSDRKIRRVYKDWPILGPESVYAARAALASRYQNKYIEFHHALMESRVNLTEQTILDIGVRAGLDKAQLLRDMERPEIEAQLRRNFELADALKLNGTPSFVIGDNVVRGARDLQTLRNLVAEARAKNK